MMMMVNNSQCLPLPFLSNLYHVLFTVTLPPICCIQSPKHLPPGKPHSHSMSSPLACLHSVPPSTSLWQKCASNASKSRRSAAAYSGLSPIMLRAMRSVDQILSDIIVAAAPPGPLAALAPSPAAWRCRDRASRKCSTASLWMKNEGRLTCTSAAL